MREDKGHRRLGATAQASGALLSITLSLIHEHTHTHNVSSEFLKDSVFQLIRRFYQAVCPTVQQTLTHTFCSTLPFFLSSLVSAVPLY